MPPDKNPLVVEKVEYDFYFLSAVLNRVQIYSYSYTYYLRKKKNSKEESYRFYFLYQINATPKVTKEFNLRFQIFFYKRNDLKLNIYNRLISFFLANTNITVYISVEAIKAYIAKYVSKGEVSTKSYIEIVKDILQIIGGYTLLVNLVQKQINKLVGERDQST